MWKWKESLVFSHILGISIFLAIPNPAHARCAYDRQSAATFANRYAPQNSYHMGYMSFSNDCANFVSQCIIAGGIDIERWAQPAWLAGYSGAKTIPNVENLMQFLTPFSYGGGIYRENIHAGTVLPTFHIGDVVTFLYDGGWHHSAIAVVKYHDPGSYGNYYVDDFLVNSHSTTNGDNNYQAPLSHFTYYWPIATFFNITTTKEEEDEACTGDTGGGGGPSTGCGALRKRWVPTAAN